MIHRKLNTGMRVLLDRGDTHLFRWLSRLEIDVVLLADFDLTRHFHERCFEAVERLKKMFGRFD